MSGGVDSSVAALLLKRAGFQVEGAHMKLSGGNPEAIKAAKNVAKRLGIKFHVVDLSKKFKKEIIDYFLDSYKRGLTPNPCVKCNQKIKFGELLKAAGKLDGDFLATGHYVQSSILNYQLPINKSGAAFIESPKAVKLSKARFKEKDQSYFLYTLTQKQLSKVLFPLSGMANKDEVRKIADQAGLPYIKSESQDVCFLFREGKAIQHNDFLRKHLKLKPGPIILIDRGKDGKSNGRGVSNGPGAKSKPGKVIGEHQGLSLYTIGQRREIRIGGTGPYYAAKFDVKKNILYVVKDFDDPILYKDELAAKAVNWVSGKTPKMPLKCEAVIRYRHAPVKCTVTKSGNSYRVKFKNPQRAITPGQSIVFYKGEEVLGGGIIK